MNTYDKSSLILIPGAVKSGKVYSQRPENGDGDFTFSRASTATRVNENGLIESVSSNTPRLDYSDSSCPSLLLEPQRTNLITQSEYFDSWTKISSPTITNNYGISPEGVQNSTRFETTSGRITTDVGTINANETFSIYMKGSGALLIQLGGLDNFYPSLTNEWVRYEFKTTQSGFNSSIQIRGAGSAVDVELYGAQYERNSYPTSYIPTSGSSVTRVGPVVNTGTSSANIIGQQSGVIYAEFKASIAGTSSNWLSLSKGSATSNWIFIGKDYNKMRSYLKVNNVVIFSNTGPLLTGDYQKVALRYESGNSAIFINGIKIAEYPSATYAITETLDRVSFGTPYAAPSEKTNWKQVILFPTALTDEEAIALTTL